MNPSSELRRALDRVGLRFRLVRLWGGLAVCWAVLAAVGLAAGVRLVPGDPTATNRLLALLVGAALASGLLCWLVARRTARDPHWLARRVEAANPDLAALLLAAVDQQPSAEGR